MDQRAGLTCLPGLCRVNIIGACYELGAGSGRTFLGDAELSSLRGISAGAAVAVELRLWRIAGMRRHRHDAGV